MGLISRVSSRTYRSKMRTQLCQFSAMKIYPGHGKNFIRYDGKRIVLINGKSERLFRKKKNPRKVTWTVLYRRKHKKGTMTELDAKKRAKRTVKVNRGIGGQSWAEIQAKKNQKPEIRKAQREAAIAAQKAKKKEAADRKKAAAKSAKGAAPKAGKQQFSKKQPKSAKPNVGGKR